MVLFGVFIYFFFNSEVDSNLRSAHVTLNNVKDMLMPIVITLSVINIIVSSIVISAFVLLASHKIAGPMYRFNQALVECKNKDFTSIANIRKGDELVECSVSLANAVDTIGDDLKKIEQHVNDLRSHVDKDTDKLAIKGALGNLENIISSYKLN